ncbi:MAG: hypothetical protein ABIP49_09120 [Lysobacterales bacterium]
MKKPLISTLVTGVLLVAAADAFACGETLFRTGQGMRYNSYAAPRPATVLIYSDATSATAKNERELRQGLEKAGHRVTVVSNAEGWSTATGARPFDVVIADLAEIDALTESMASASAKPDFLPVVTRSDGTERELRARFAWCVREGAGVGQYLKAINKVMEARVK